MISSKEKIYRFTVVGAGHVLTKYLLPASIKKKTFRLQRIISRMKRGNFMSYLYSNPDYPKYRGLDLSKIIYQRTDGTASDIVNKINEIPGPNEVILILTPPKTHFKILEETLGSTDKQIYLEKPAVTNLQDFEQLILLMNRYKDRIYLPEEYAYGRAPIFFETYRKYRQRLGRINSFILHLEEGQEYFETIQKWVANLEEEGQKYFDLTQSWFADIGPELDLGVHLLGILFKLLGKDISYQITAVRQPEGFLRNYGVEAEILLTQKDKSQFKVFLRSGKREGKNTRFFKMICENGALWQEFTSGTSEDPVFIELGSKKKQLTIHPKDYLYFAAQLSEFLSWLKKPYEQNFVLLALKCALEIKDIRLKNQERQVQAKKNKLVAMIPAIMNSRQLKKKNIREMAGKPMIYYAIKATIDAKIFDEIYVNSESDLIGAIGRKLGVNYYKRDPKLAHEDVNNEEFVYDFLQHIKTDYLFMIHSNKPLITSEEIRRFVETMLKQKVDTMFSVEELKTQVFFEDKPINFDVNKPHIRSWEIKPIHAVQWTITGWKREVFLRNYQKKGFSAYSGKIGLFPISEYAKISVDYEKDFILAEQIMKLKLDSRKKALKGLIGEYHQKMAQVLDSLDLEKVQKIIKALIEVYNKKGKIFLMGNGGSATTASHFAADLTQNVTSGKKNRINAVCLNDSIPRLTAIANDIGYENIFVEQMYNNLNKDDAVVVISGSGNSANIIKAVKFAKKTGVKTIALLGFDGGKVMDMVDAAVLVKSFDYTVVENTHMFICDLVTNYFQKMLNDKRFSIHGANLKTRGKFFLKQRKN